MKVFYLFLDWKNDYLHDIGNTNWVTVYKREDSDHKFGKEQCTIFSALIPESRLKDVSKTVDWDIHVGDGIPTLVINQNDSETSHEYYSFNNPNEIIPLVHLRTFYGARPQYVEILEEFRLFHELYHDKEGGTYIKFLDDGSEQHVIRVFENYVEIRLKELKQFLAVRKMKLGVYFDVMRFHNFNIKEIEEDDRQIFNLTSNILYKYYIDDLPSPIFQKYVSCSRIRGKKLIEGYPIERSGIYPYVTLEYEKFIIGVDKYGKELEYSANPDELGNLFGKNPNSPLTLTPVFFRKEVLQRYYDEPEKYSIQDGVLYCNNFWSLRMDNNHDNYIIVFLGDLGKELPYSQQKIWRAYNIEPDGGLSDVAFRRAILGEWAESSNPLLRFKSNFRTFQEKWYEHFDWYLFKPLNQDDEYHFDSLHIPFHNNFSEFDKVILSLTKLLIDSLNESKVVKLISQPIPDNTKGIGKFSMYLEQENVVNREQIIEFMKRLQMIRSISSAHRKGSKFPKDIAKANINVEDLSSEFVDIIETATYILILLANHYLESDL